MRPPYTGKRCRHDGAKLGVESARIIGGNDELLAILAA